jgi:hypothetical protein
MIGRRSSGRALRRSLVIAIAAIAGVTATASAQTITAVTPSEATYGTEVTIAGTGFGTRKPKMYLSRTGLKKRVRLRAVTVTDTEIRALVSPSASRLSLAGVFDLNLRKSGAPMVVVPDAIELKLPTNLTPDRPFASHGEIVTMSGTFLGSRRGRVLVSGLPAQVVEWNAIGEAPGTVRFRVPSSAPDGLADVEIKNAIGRVVVQNAFAVDGTGGGGGGGGGGGTTTPGLRVVSAGATSNTEVLVQFNQPVLGGIGDAENPAHYRITTEPIAGSTVPAGSTLIVLDAVLVADRSTVKLTTLSQSDVRYKVTVTSVRDIYGRPIAAPLFIGDDPSSTTFAGIAPLASDLVDSDGDGLTDAAEQRGWTIAITRTNGDIVVRTVTSDPGDPREPLDSVRNAAARDTDADGIGDLDELHYGIDPRNPDADGDTLSDFRELNWIYSDPATQDSDGDGMDDGLEFGFFKTSPLILDTDGDQLDDARELFVSNRNPRSADLPRHAISIGDVFVELNVEYSFVTTRDLSQFENKTASVTLEQATSSEVTNTDTNTTEWFAKAGVSASAGASWPGGLSASVEFTAEAGIGASGTYVETNESKETSSQAQQDTETSGANLLQGETETRSVTGARLVVPVSIENISDIAFTMSNVEITALIPNPADPTSLIPIATLLPEAGTSDTYNFGTIDTRLGPFRFVSNESSINPDLIDSLLAEPKSIIFRVSNFNILDELGRNFAFQQQDVTERTAPVVIDYGNGEVERHWVALGTGRITPYDGATADNNGDGSVDELDRIVFDPIGKPVGIDLVQALQEVVGLHGIQLDFSGQGDTQDPVERQNSFAYQVVRPYGPDSGLFVNTVVRIRDKKANLENREAWTLLTKQGYDVERSFDSVVLKRSEGVTFAFVADRDGDGVTGRIEALYGTSDLPLDVDPSAQDTDGDGRSDYQEIYQSFVVAVVGELPRDVFSNPTQADQDGDGLDDSDEFAAGTDPRLADTDGDGACDGPGDPACPVDDFPLDPTLSGRPPLLAQYLFTSPPDAARTIVNSSTAGMALDAAIVGDTECVVSVNDRSDIGNGAYHFNDPNVNSSCQESDGKIGEIQAPHIGIGSSFSIAAWVFPTGSNDAWIAGQAGTAFEAGWARLQLGVVANANTPLGAAFKVSLVVPGPNAMGNLVVTDPVPVTQNAWTLYTGVVINNGTTTTGILYRNDTKVAQQAVAGAFANPSMTDLFYIGGVGGVFNFDFKGAIDDVRVYDGALSAVNVAELYALP